MEKDQKVPRTAVAVQQATKNRLQSHMKYGETIDGMVNKLLDLYEQYTEQLESLVPKTNHVCVHPKDKDWPSTCPRVESKSCKGCEFWKILPK